MSGRVMAIVGLLAVLALAAVAIVVFSRDRTLARLTVPPRGEGHAAFLDDGHPVWIISHQDGSISVLDAISAHVPFGVGKLTWWCPDTRTIRDPFHGSDFSEYGDRIGGPAETGLGEYGGSVEDGVAVVQDRYSRRPVDDRPIARMAGCMTAEATVHDVGQLPEAGSPAEAAGHTDGRWRRVSASLLAAEGDVGWLCPTESMTESCAQVPMPGFERTNPDRAAQSIEVWTDASWLVRAEDGRVVALVQVPQDPSDAP